MVNPLLNSQYVHLLTLLLKLMAFIAAFLFMDKKDIYQLTLQQVSRRIAFVRKEIEKDNKLRKLYGGDYVWQDRVEAINARIKGYKFEQYHLKIRRRQLLVPKLKQDVADAYKNRRELLGPKRVWIKPSIIILILLTNCSTPKHELTKPTNERERRAYEWVDSVAKAMGYIK